MDASPLSPEPSISTHSLTTTKEELLDNELRLPVVADVLFCKSLFPIKREKRLFWRETLVENSPLREF